MQTPIHQLFLSVLAVVFLTSCNFDSKRYCRRGHLTEESSCVREYSSSILLTLGYGWDAHLAKGKVNPSLCSEILKTTEAGRGHGFGSVTGKYKNVPCNQFLPDFGGTCIFGQKDREVALLAIDDQCVSGVFFNGRNRTLSQGKIVPLQ